MFERFTPDAKRAVVLAQQEAREARRPSIEADDLVAGVLVLPRCLGSWLLTGLGVDVAAVLSQVRSERPTGDGAPEGNLPFTPGAKAELEQSMLAMASFDDEHIGTEHLVLVALIVGRSRASQLLNQAGVDAARYRAAIAAHPTRVRSGAIYADAPAFPQAVEHLRAGDGERALAQADVALAEATRSGNQPALAHAQNLLGWIVALRLIESRYDEALALVDQALATLPTEDAIIGTRLALLTVMGRGAETIVGQERILSLGDEVLGEERGISHSLLARAYLDSGDIDRARFHLREAERQPTPWPVHSDTWRRIDELDGTWRPS